MDPTSPELRWLSWALQVLLLGGVAYVINSISGLRHDLHEQNGRVIALETWRPLHERTDEERYDQEKREREILIRDHQISREGVQNEQKLTREGLQTLRDTAATRTDVELIRTRIEQLRDHHGRRGSSDV